MAIWGIVSAGLALASLAVAPKAKEEAMDKAIQKALAEREAKQQETESKEEED